MLLKQEENGVICFRTRMDSLMEHGEKCAHQGAQDGQCTHYQKSGYTPQRRKTKEGTNFHEIMYANFCVCMQNER